MRKVFLLDLRDESLSHDYEDCHRPGMVPAEVLADIRASGIQAMEIYCLGDRLVMVTETSEGVAPAARAAAQTSRDWEARMDSFQRPLPGSEDNEKWRPARRIFDLNEHDQKEFPG